MSSWFDKLFAEFKERGEAMFAFSQQQVEEQGVPWDQFEAEWRSATAGLQIKKSAWDEFHARMEADFEAWQASLPELKVRYLGRSDSWDRPMYRDDTGRVLVDVGLNPPNEAVELHTTVQGEPDSAVPARLVFVTSQEEGA